MMRRQLYTALVADPLTAREHLRGTESTMSSCDGIGFTRKGVTGFGYLQRVLSAISWHRRLQ
jgi:hypothetical protein